MKSKHMRMVMWDAKCKRERGITVKCTDSFDARGMVRVFGRCDNFPGSPAFHMDIWRNRAGRVFARFWSLGTDVDWISYEIVWTVAARQPSVDSILDENWVPEPLRREYDNWIISELPFPKLTYRKLK